MTDAANRANRALDRLGQVDVKALVGSGFFWAWVDGLFANVFFGPFNQIGMSELAVWLISALGAPIAVAILVRPGIATRGLAGTGALLALGFVGSIGSFLLIFAAWLIMWPFLVAGAIVCAVFMAGAIVAWGAVYCRGGARTATLYACGGFAFAAVPELLFFAMVRPIPSFLFALMPLASMALLVLIPQADRSYASRPTKPAVSASPTDPARSRIAAVPARLARTLGVSGGMVCAFVLVMLGFGYMQHLMSFSGMPGFATATGDVTVQTTRVFAAVALFATTILVPKYAHLAYRTGLLLIVAGFSLMPFLYGGDYFWVSGAVIMCGYTAFDALMWTVVAQVGYARIGDALRAVCVMQLLIKGVFSSLGALAAIALTQLGASAVFACADAIFVGYLMTIAIVLLLSNAAVWELFAARPPVAPVVAQGGTMSAEEVVQARVAAVGEAYALTEREREVFAYLAQGRTQPWIAEALGISESTVNSHVRHIYAKLDINSKQELLDLVARAAQASEIAA